MRFFAIGLCLSVFFSCLSSPGAPIGSVQSGNWESTVTWGGSLPGSSDDVTIGHTVTITASGQKDIQSLVVNGTLRHSSNGTSDQSYRVDLNVSGDVTVNVGAYIDVNGRGYSGGYNNQNGYGTGKGYMATGNGRCGGGAGHGGQGGPGKYDAGPGGSAGTIYGSVDEPSTIGSGGGGAASSGQPANAGEGGGAVKLQAQNVTVDGTIRASGTDGNQGAARAGGGGSGGSIWIAATGVLGGSGSIEAKGGAGQANSYGNSAGAGGGGRIALYYASKTFDGTVTAQGGASAYRDGGAGAIYAKQGANAPDLLIDNFITSGMGGSAGTWVDNAVATTCNSITIERYGILKHASETPMDIAVSTLTIGQYGSLNVSSR
ncbi:hypothetical protein ACFLSJ_07650, partial [Verrucomicrobiota bacterium]